MQKTAKLWIVDALGKLRRWRDHSTFLLFVSNPRFSYFRDAGGCQSSHFSWWDENLTNIKNNPSHRTAISFPSFPSSGVSEGSLGKADLFW